MTVRISNRQARHLLIQTHGLSSAPLGPIDLSALIKTMGYVQLDTIRTVSRAHHHILWSRNQNYREPMLWQALKNRDVFEHFTHDASILPIEFYPIWQWQFDRIKDRFKNNKRWKIDADLLTNIKARITAEGALSTHAFDTKIKNKKEMWARPPHKNALDYMWYTGQLTTAHRENFIKFYDLPERVIPNKFQNMSTPTDKLSWLCEEALKRLTLATASELQDFWGAASAQQIKHWFMNSSYPMQHVDIETHENQWLSGVAVADIETRLQTLAAPTSRLRILSPFDPLVRNRKRLNRIFGFDYKIEIFVPAAKRQWGYYVYPILEGERFIGRIELKADRKAGTLSVIKLWTEPNIKWSHRRDDKLDSELKRLTQLANVETVYR